MKTQVQTSIQTAKESQTRSNEMWQLYAKYYDVDEKSFTDRIAKNDYYAIYQVNNKIVGFTALRMRPVETSEGKVMTFYAGQSVIHADYRKRSLIPRTLVKLFWKHFTTQPHVPIYMWCDALTYKPYLLFANSLLEFYPSRRGPTPMKVEEVIQNIGQHYYGNSFNSLRGTVKKEKNIIDDPSAKITEEEKLHPDIKFFAEANPNYHKGHGLITIAPIDFQNFVYLAGKCLKKKFFN